MAPPPAGPVEPDTLGQRLIAAFFRAALRASLRPSFRQGRPVTQQRRRLELFARAALVPGAARFSPASVGGVPGEWVEARGGATGRRVVLYLHGGAYCVGSPATHRAMTGQLALRADARVFVADYRLAPEHTFPAAVEDAVAAYAALLGAGSRPAEIAVAGDSAGAGLSVATALRLRELGRPLPSGLVLFCPWADLDTRTLGPPPAGETTLTHAWLEECAKFYLAGRDASEPLASPLHADLTHLPPTLIQVGSDEILLGDAERLHARLRAAGVDSTLRVYPRRWHVFQMHAGLLRDSDRAMDEAARFVRARTAS
jgi:acetyl esterase/lipase